MMETWTSIKPGFNLNSNPRETGCWVHMADDRIAFRDRALILPSIRLSYSGVEGFKILQVQESSSLILVRIVGRRGSTGEIEFRYYQLHDGVSHL